jgi:uncharacterized protein (DUF2236 family)
MDFLVATVAEEVGVEEVGVEVVVPMVEVAEVVEAWLFCRHRWLRLLRTSQCLSIQRIQPRIMRGTVIRLGVDIVTLAIRLAAMARLMVQSIMEVCVNEW